MICICDCELKVGDQFLNKYTNPHCLCEIVETGHFYWGKRNTDWIKFIFLDDAKDTSEPMSEDDLFFVHDDQITRIELGSIYAKKCFIFNRNKNLDILLNDSTSPIT
jgi:hypothetical protein